MELPAKKRAFTAILTNLSRLLLGGVLTASGFVKAVDPQGLFYKLKEYAFAFSLDAIPDVWVQVVSIFLPAVEFMLGVLLLSGVYNRLVTRLVFIVFLLFTPFTLVVAWWNPVQECGCFGDAVHMSNWVTFAKNMLLLAFATMVCVKHRLFVRKVSSVNRWMLFLFSLFFIAAVEVVGVHNLPIIDFRPFAIGVDLREATEDTPPEYRIIYRLEKDGRIEEFTDDTYPDSTWRYLGSKTEIIKAGYPALILDFAFLDNEGYDCSPDILADSGYVFLLIMHSLESADESRVDKINELYDYCAENSVPLYAATSSDAESILRWKKRTGAEYPFLWADDIMLKTMVRANPGMFLLKDGKVLGKWNVEYMPHVDVESEPEVALKKLVDDKSVVHNWKIWLLVFTVGILFIIVVDLPVSAKKKEADNEIKE